LSQVPQAIGGRWVCSRAAGGQPPPQCRWCSRARSGMPSCASLRRPFLRQVFPYNHFCPTDRSYPMISEWDPSPVFLPTLRTARHFKEYPHLLLHLRLRPTGMRLSSPQQLQLAHRLPPPQRLRVPPAPIRLPHQTPLVPGCGKSRRRLK